MGSGCCTDGRVVACDARDTSFESRHRQISFTINYLKDEWPNFFKKDWSNKIMLTT